jgi:hypothetical protein
MTYEEALVEVRDRVNESSSTDLWADSAIIRYLDQGMRAMCRTRGVEETWLQYLASSDQMNYPSDWKQLLRAYYVTSVVESGTATSGGATSLTDTANTWTVNECVGDFLVITGGTGSGQVRRITSNTANALTVATWTTNPSSDSTYELYEGRLANSPLIFVGTDFNVHDGLMTFDSNIHGVIVLLGTRLPDHLIAGATMDLTDEYAVGAVEYATAMCYYKDENVVLAQSHMALFAEVRQRWEYNPSVQPITVADTWYGSQNTVHYKHEPEA